MKPKAFVRAMIVGHDPGRRRTVRAAATSLLPKTLPDGDLSGIQLAQLALARLLWLQVEVRRAARWRQHEAAVLLSRASIETAIAGFYCLKIPDAPQNFRGQTGRNIEALLGDLVSSEFGFDLHSLLRQEFGQDSAPLPGAMANALADTELGPGVTHLYRHFYAPLSAVYVHASPMSLMRQTRVRSSRLRTKPFALWSRRSAVHTSDAMMGALAGQLARELQRTATPFDEYYSDHWRLVLAPLFFMARVVILGRVHPARIPRLVRLVTQMRRQNTEGTAFAPEQVDDLINALSNVIGKPTDATRPLVEHLRTRLLEDAPLTRSND